MSIAKILDRKTAIITGAGRGIGRAIAVALGDAGMSVVLASRTQSEVDETAAILHAKDQPALAFAVDVSDWTAVQALVEHTVQQYGGVDILVNDAGMQGCIGPLVENDPLAWEQTIRVNLMGTFYCCKAVLPTMIRQHSGKIINLSGGGATAPRPYYSAYAASKAAIVRLTETLAEEVREHNIQVNAIAPGTVNTRMLDETLSAGATAGGQALADAKRQLESGGTSPELGAALVVFLASDTSDGITGKLIAAVHDSWQSWEAEDVQKWISAPWFTLRRIDPYTLKQFIQPPNGEDHTGG